MSQELCEAEGCQRALHLTVGMHRAALELSCEICGEAGHARGCAALLLACMQPHQRKHCSQLCLQSRRASPEPAEAAAHICSGGHTSCTALTLLLLIYSPAFFFFPPPPPSCRRISLRQDLPAAVSARVVPSAEF